MGNTILAHALFSCEQVELNLDTFFSSNGNSHAIQKNNKTNLTARHLVEYPDPALQCVMQVVCRGWWELLRLRMSYAKWFNQTPNLSNVLELYPHRVNLDKEQDVLWKDFYTIFKDPTWPDCGSINDISTLPVEVQQEIVQAYRAPEIAAPKSDSQMTEWLATTYYDGLCNATESIPHSSRVLLLEDYIQGNSDALIDVCENILGWRWNYDRSCQFYNKMLLVNQEYLDWLDQIKTAVSGQKACRELAHWEQALVIAKWCFDEGKHPSLLNWNNVGCNTFVNNLYLNLLLRTHHGKTI